MRARSFKLLLCILAFATNLVGSPMAWGNMSTHGASKSTQAIEAANEHCGDAESPKTETTHDGDCCVAGSCQCDCATPLVATTTPIRDCHYLAIQPAIPVAGSIFAGFYARHFRPPIA